jgi:hypothetical protein
VFATDELAQLYEQEGDIHKAGEYYEEALMSFLQYGGDRSSGALLMLKDLISFHFVPSGIVKPYSLLQAALSCRKDII